MPSGTGSWKRREDGGRCIANRLREEWKGQISCKLTIEKFPRPSPAGGDQAKGEAMKIGRHFNNLPMLVLLGAATVGAQVQPQVAQRWFQEAKKLCERDAGRLWGVSLCGPMVIFDQATGTHATSQAEPE